MRKSVYAIELTELIKGRKANQRNTKIARYQGTQIKITRYFKSFVLNGTTLRHGLMLLWFKDLMNVTRRYNS